MKVLVIGIPGVGKTTVIKESLRETTHYEVVNFGTEMLKTGKEKEVVENRDELRNLPPKKGKELQKKTAERLSKKENVIIDTHLAIETPKGILPGIPRWILEEIDIDRVVLIEADPKEVKARRKKDKSRERSDFQLPAELHQELNRNYAAVVSTFTGALIKIIKNEENKINEAAEELRKTLTEE